MSKAEKTRQYIIEKTAPVFNAKGYAGTSLSDLEKATGLTKGSIYGNFGNKDEIAIAAFRYNVAQVGAFLKDKIQSETNAVNKLLVFPDVYRNYFKIPCLHGGCPIFNTSTEADDTHPELRVEARLAINNWRQSIERIVQAGIENKEIKKNTQPKEIAVIIISLIEGGVMMSKASDNKSAINIAMDFLEQKIHELRT
ncbi:MAG: TetR/AcrR family transcriptional regulator [Bacteroidetes bacterium]|nr:TetR/AcrR family transcriptional regulator [Bacteroidota bacterium]